MVPDDVVEREIAELERLCDLSHVPACDVTTYRAGRALKALEHLPALIAAYRESRRNERRPYADPNCSGCGKPLTVENAWMTDGCPCNSELGINSMNETRWSLLMQLQQRDGNRAAAAERSVAEHRAALVMSLDNHFRGTSGPGRHTCQCIGCNAVRKCLGDSTETGPLILERLQQSASDVSVLAAALRRLWKAWECSFESLEWSEWSTAEESFTSDSGLSRADFDRLVREKSDA